MTTAPHVVVSAPPKKADRPSASGFCQKLEVFLRYSKISYELRSGYPYTAPKGKVPYAEITHDGRTVTVPDSHFIIQYLVEHDLIKDPDELAGLTKAQRAESRAFQGYIEEVLYPAIVYDRWCVDENYAVAVQESSPGQLSWPLRPLVAWYLRRRIANALYGGGTGRHSPEEVRRLQTEAFEALETKYTGHAYFHGGDVASRIDLTVYGFLANILSLDANPYFKHLVLQSAVLRSFVHEMTTALFPEYTALLLQLQT